MRHQALMCYWQLMQIEVYQSYANTNWERDLWYIFDIIATTMALIQYKDVVLPL